MPAQATAVSAIVGVISVLPTAVIISLFTDLSFVDGSLITGVIAMLISAGGFVYTVWTRQKQMRRDMYGSDDDDTHDGLLVEQEQKFNEVTQRLDTFEEHFDERLDEMEHQMAQRHDEMSVTIAQIIDNMEDPPETVKLRSPWEYEDGYNFERNDNQ